MSLSDVVHTPLNGQELASAMRTHESYFNWCNLHAEELREHYAGKQILIGTRVEHTEPEVLFYADSGDRGSELIRSMLETLSSYQQACALVKYISPPGEVFII